MKHMDKKFIEDFNIEEARGYVLDRSNHIENIISDIIVDYLDISLNDKKKFMKEIILNSSVISAGSKNKILGNIVDKKKLLSEIRELNSIRNGFAHASVGQIISINVLKNNKVKTDLKKSIYVMDSSGKLKNKVYKDYLKRFCVLYDSIKKEILKLKK